ncbi:MAG: hypothetical protein H6581_23655 [Bacteroidia bacterium]|nr:hypothetical protein [Bacteroidia bacterium]
MKTLALLSLCLLGFVSTASDDILRKDRISTDQDKARFFLELAREYDQDALNILRSEDNPTHFTVYARDANSRAELLKTWNTVVHETAHGFDFSLAEYGENAYYIADQMVIHTPRTPVYNSRELVQVLPDSMNDAIMRFDPYIDGDIPNLSSQVSGIYGLLEEMNAYYHGTKASVALYKYYRTFCPDNNFECWGKGYLSDPSTTLSALYEFRLFIAWYLDYGRDHHPEMYEDLQENRSLRAAYTLIDQQFEDLVYEFEEIRTAQMDRMNAAGTSVSLSDDGFLMHHYQGGSYGTGTFIPYNQKLQRMLTPDLQKELDYFKVQGLTLENCREFLLADNR